MDYGYYGLKKKSLSGSVPKCTYYAEAAMQCGWQVKVLNLMNQLFISGNGIYL